MKPDEATELVLGEILEGKYQIIRLLGVGGMGAVYAAKRLALGDVVAIKCILQSQNTEANRGRFLREARAMARIRHPNVAQVFDFGEPKDRSPYMVMEYLEGPTLARVLREQGRLPLDRALFLFSRICAAIEAGHRRGVTHRDLKPANVVLARSDDGRERIKVLDFGLARIASSPSLALTSPGSLLGTCSYMAPEQIEGKETGPKVDVFALGVILYEMLSGKLPYSGASQLAVMLRITEGKHEPIGEHVPDLPAGVAEGIEAAIATDAAARPKSPEELARLVGAPLAMEAGDHSGEIPVATTPAPGESLLAGEPTISDISGSLSGDEDTIVGEGALVETSIAPDGPDADAFVGREDALERLRRAYGDVIDGRGRITVITGDAGVGKTRLLDEFAGWAQRQGAVVLRGRFFSYEGDRPPPYETFLWMLSSESGSQEHPLARENRPGVEATAPGEDKWHAFSTMVEAFAERSDGLPLVVALDNLQWATALDLEFLAYLPRAASPQNVMVVGTARPISDEEATTHELSRWLSALGNQRALSKVAVGPFDDDLVRKWLSASFDRIRVRQQDVRRLQRATGGNPYYLSEVVRHLVDSEIIRREPGGWTCEGLEDVTLPETVHSVVHSKLEGLPDEVRKVLETACVIGEEFRFETLQAAIGMDEDELEAQLERATRRHLLSEENLAAGADYRCHTTTLRSVLYADMSPRRRRRIHRRVVDALHDLYASDSDRIAKVLCYHYHAVGDWRETLSWGLLATQQTLDCYDTDSAEAALRRARRAAKELRSSERPPSPVRLATLDHLTGLLYTRVGRLEEAQPLLQRAIAQAEEAGDALLEVEALLALADCQFSCGEREAGLETGRRATAHANSLRQWRREAEARIHVARCAAPLGRYEEAIEALGPVTARPTGKDAALASLRSLALRELAWIHAKRGAFSDGDKAARAALEVARESGDALAEYAAVSVLGLVHGEAGDFETAIPHLEQALALARRLSFRRREAIELLNLGECSHLIGRHDEAARWLQESLQILLEIQDRASEGGCRVNLGRVMLAQGERADAVAMLEKGRELCAQRGISEYEGLALIALAEVHREDGDLDSARRALERGQDLFARIDSFHRWRAELALAHVAKDGGRSAAALKHARMANELAQAHRRGLRGKAAENFEPAVSEAARLLAELEADQG